MANFAAGVVDTGGQFSACVVDTGVNFAAGVVDTCGKFVAGVIETGGHLEFSKKCEMILMGYSVKLSCRYCVFFPLTGIATPSRVYLIDTGNEGRARDSRTP